MWHPIEHSDAALKTHKITDVHLLLEHQLESIDGYRVGLGQPHLNW